jgi:hypothetical protein
MRGVFYFLLILVAGFWLVRVLVPKIDRRRNSRRIQRGIAECLDQIATEKSKQPRTIANKASR